MDASTATRLSPLFLYAVALFFGAAGLVSWFSPSIYVGLFDLELASAHATTDARASYGGANLGVALFLAWAARDPRRFVPGLVGGVAVGGAMGVARTTGIVLDGTREGIQWAYLAMEVGGVAIGLWLLSALSRADADP